MREQPFARPLAPLIRPLLVALCLGAAIPAAIAQAAAPASAPASAPAGPTLRPEAAKALGAAQDLLKAGNAKEALAQVAVAEALPGLTPYESYITRRLKAPATFMAGDPAQALLLFEVLIGDALLPPQDKPTITETTVKLALQQKDYARAARWMKVYVDGGGQDAEIRRLYPQVLSLNGDHAAAVAGYKAQMAAEEAAGRMPTEASLRLLASSQAQSGDGAGYLVTLERLASSTGKADYWSELISRTSRSDGFATERLQLDVYRLRQAVGVALTPGELGDMAYRANQAGLPGEAKQLLDDGFARKLLGQDANAEADRKLRDQATKAAAQDRAGATGAEAALRSAKDGNSAFGLGFALSGAGLHDQALPLMVQAQAKGGLRRPDDAMLHLGVAQWRAGKVDDAVKSFAAVRGTDGAAELARLWLLYLKSPARK
jgi:hypothetical protein